MNIDEIYRFFKLKQELYAVVETMLTKEFYQACHVTNVYNVGGGLITVEYIINDKLAKKDIPIKDIL